MWYGRGSWRLGEELVLEAVVEPAEGAVEDVLAAAPLVRDEFGALDRDERGGVADLAQLLGLLLGDELAVREDLEEAVGMLGEEVEQAGMHEGLAAEDAEERVPVLLGFVHDLVEVLEIEFHLRFVDVDPAALAAQVAAVEDGEGRGRAGNRSPPSSSPCRDSPSGSP